MNFLMHGQICFGDHAAEKGCPSEETVGDLMNGVADYLNTKYAKLQHRIFQVLFCTRNHMEHRFLACLFGCQEME